MTMEAEKTSLASQIAKILEPTSSELARKDGSSVASEIFKKMEHHM